MGVGLLSVPLALKMSGYAGVLVLLFLGVVTNYTGKALCRCAITVGKQMNNAPGQMVKYEDIAGAAFGQLGKQLVSLMMYMELTGTCALLIILESDNLWNLVAGQAGSGGAVAAGALPAAISSHQNVFWLSALIVAITVWAPDVKSLSFLGLCGFMATVCVTLAVGYLLVTGDFVSGATTMMVNWQTLPLCFGIMAFSYAGHAVFPSIQASMQDPHEFPSVINTAYLIVAGICTFLGVAGYYMYGTGCQDLITFNMKPGTIKTLCAALILVNPLAKFAITLEPVVYNLREAVSTRAKIPLTYLNRSIINFTAAAGVVMIARFLPYLSVVMSLVGSFLTIGISIILPAAALLKLNGTDMSRSEKLWAHAVVMIGLACALSGTAAALMALKAKMSVAALA